MEYTRAENAALFFTTLGLGSIMRQVISPILHYKLIQTYRFQYLVIIIDCSHIILNITTIIIKTFVNMPSYKAFSIV